MIHALTAALITALVLAAIVRAARPGGLLAFLGGWWEWWGIFKPRWLNDKVTGGCPSCTSFWWLGVPAAVLVALLTPPTIHLHLLGHSSEVLALYLNGWCVVVPPIVAVVFEIAIQK